MERQRIGYGPPSTDKALGSLPVVAELCRRLDIAGIVDRAVPIRDVALLTHGQVIEALVANRLTSPQPLVHVEDWARAWAVEEVFGMDPAALNDDRIGRALDAVAPELDGIVGSVGMTAIGAFGIDVSRMHWDMTSVSLFGAYADAEEDFAQPRFGHPKDRRPDLKQVQTGLGVTADGAVPIYHRAYSGGAGEVNQVVGAMEALRALAGEKRFMIVGDSKLVSYVNLAAMVTAQVRFIAPASKTYVDAATLAAQDLDSAIPADYVAERDKDKAPHQRGRWLVAEDATAITGPRKADPVVALRRVFVWSSARSGAAQAARAKKLARATDDLDRLGRGLGSRHYPTVKAVDERLNAIARERRVKAYLKTEVGTDAAGKPTLVWHFDQQALDVEAASDGWYALLTNLDRSEADATEILLRYKGQEAVERRYGNFKGPLAVAPMFLTNNRRIEALISVICLALLVFSLVERALRLAIAPERALAGLGVGRATKPTGRLIFSALSLLRLNPAIGDTPATIPQPPALQARILELL
ncbi:MAG: IS1634 family transposase, partial [Candidatus Dormibacteria bacterium]